MKNSNLQLQTISLLFIAFFLFAVSLIYLKGVLLPFVIAVFIYFAVSPAMDFLQNRLGINKALSFLIMGIFLAISISLLVLIFSQSFQQFAQGADVYQQKLEKAAISIQHIANVNGIDLDASMIRNSIKDIPIFSVFKQATGNFINFIGQAFLVFILVLFLVTSPSQIQKSREFFNNVHIKVSKYVNTKFITSFSTGLLVGLIFFILDLELAALFAILAFSLNFIPSIGSIIATLIPLPVAYLQFDLGLSFWLCLILPGLVQISIGNVLEPKIMGKNLDLHPITTIIALLFWGMLWGIPGMFLAVPITAILKIIFEQSEATRPVANILAGRL